MPFLVLPSYDSTRVGSTLRKAGQWKTVALKVGSTFLPGTLVYDSLSKQVCSSSWVAFCARPPSNHPRKRTNWEKQSLGYHSWLYFLQPMKKRKLSRGWDVELFPGRRFRTRVSHVLYDQTHALSFFFIVASSCLVLDYDTYCLIKAWRCLCLAFS